jgi:hypothetical protein
MTTATIAESPPEHQRRDPPRRQPTPAEVTEAIRRELEGKTVEGHILGYN